MNTTTKKDSSNKWTSETRIPLWDKYELRVNTFKTDRGLVTSVSVGERKGCAFTHTVHEDFYRTAYADPSVRCTEKNVVSQHNAALANIDYWLHEANVHYGK